MTDKRQHDIDLIRQARLAPDIDYSPFRDRYQVDWTFSRLISDRRHGTIHGWMAAGRYLGMFTTHRKAVEAGADVTRIKPHQWFTWDIEHEWRKAGSTAGVKSVGTAGSTAV